MSSLVVIALVITIPTILALATLLFESASSLNKAFELRVSEFENDMKESWFDS